MIDISSMILEKGIRSPKHFITRWTYSSINPKARYFTKWEVKLKVSGNVLVGATECFTLIFNTFCSPPRDRKINLYKRKKNGSIT